MCAEHKESWTGAGGMVHKMVEWHRVSGRAACMRGGLPRYAYNHATRKHPDDLDTPTGLNHRRRLNKRRCATPFVAHSSSRPKRIAEGLPLGD